MIRIQFVGMKSIIKRVMVNAGMPRDKTEICARIHTESSRDGVYLHGLNQVKPFVDCLRI